MGPENSAFTPVMITSPPRLHRTPGSIMPLGRCTPCPGPPPCSPSRSPPSSSRDVSERNPASLSTDPLRRHSWQPGAMLLGHSHSDQRSVSLGDLDPYEVKMLFGNLGGPGMQDPRRAPITQYAQDLGSLLSLTEEELVSESPIFTPLEEQSSQMQGCSASAPALCASPSKHHPNHYQTQESALYSAFGGSTQSVDAESESGAAQWWREERTEARHGVEKGDKTGRTLGRTISFIRKMAGKSKVSQNEEFGGGVTGMMEK